MAVDAAFVADLRWQLVNIQASLQATMDQVTKKLDATGESYGEQPVFRSTSSALTPKEKNLQERKAALEQDQQNTVLRSTSSAQFASLSPDCEEIKDPLSPKERDLQKRRDQLQKDQVNMLRTTSASEMSPEPPNLPGLVESKNEEVAIPIKTLPDEKAVVKPFLPETPQEPKKHEALKIAAEPSKDFNRESKDADEKKVGWFKSCLQKCGCQKRMVDAGKKVLKKKGDWMKVRPLKAVNPTLFLEVTKEMNNQENIGKRLQSMRKLKAVPQRLWAPRILIEDANGDTHELKDIEGGKNKDMAFPVKCSWKWLKPEETVWKEWKGKSMSDGKSMSGKVEWKVLGKSIALPQAVWFKKMGLLDNDALRAFSMRVHARMHHCNQQVVLLTQGMIKDSENALATGTTFEENTMEWEMEMCYDVLRDIDDLLVLGFRCGAINLNIGALTQAAGCPWHVFLESYMSGRNNALSCVDKGGKRRELVLAAAKGVDGLEQLYMLLVHKIDANDLLFFKVMLLALNGITAAGQFTWTGHVEPAIIPRTTTPMPTWQNQLAVVFNHTVGGL